MTTKRYDEDFKKSIVSLHENGRSFNSLSREYGVSVSTIAKWARLYSTVSTEEGEVFTAKQIKDLQKRNVLLEEENLILKKRLPYSRPARTTTKCCKYSKK